MRRVLSRISLSHSYRTVPIVKGILVLLTWSPSNAFLFMLMLLFPPVTRPFYCLKVVLPGPGDAYRPSIKEGRNTGLHK